jgi:ABC-type molybdate transport system substrate-binding protein
VVVRGAVAQVCSVKSTSVVVEIAQSAGVIVRTRQSRAAGDFLAFVNGPVGRPIMKKFGFALPGEG